LKNNEVKRALAPSKTKPIIYYVIILQQNTTFIGCPMEELHRRVHKIQNIGYTHILIDSNYFK